MTTNRINLWSSPRNISTALLYAFAQRPDTAVVDEPLYAHYLTHQPTEAMHPGREEILAAVERDGATVVDAMLNEEYGKPTVVFKQMTHHLVSLDGGFLGQMKNVLLIRSPREILRSFSDVIIRITARDVGIPQQYELFQQLRSAGHLHAVVDARFLLLDPAGVLDQLCQRLGLPADPTMLTWPPGARPEDGVWAKYWYENVHKSTGFAPYQERIFTLPADLEGIAEECQPLYEAMLKEALR